MATTTPEVTAMTPEELRRVLASGLTLRLIDVRSARDFASDNISQQTGHEVLNLPYTDMAARSTSEDLADAVAEYASFGEFAVPDKETPIVVVCYKGRTAVAVAEGLRRAGYDATHLQCGMEGWQATFDKICCRTVDLAGLCCPMPLVRMRAALAEMEPGQTCEFICTDRGSLNDFKAWAEKASDVVLFDQKTEKRNGTEVYIHRFRKIAPVEARCGTASPYNGDVRIAALESRIADLESRMPEDRISIVAFSGDLDRILAAFVIATGAAAMGHKVTMFFTFWGLGAVKKKKSLAGKNIMEAMMALMTPGGSRQLPVSKMNYFGMGAIMLRTMMKQRNVASLEELMRLARELGVRPVVCEMSREVMGITDEELADGMESGGVAQFLADATRSRATLFI